MYKIPDNYVSTLNLYDTQRAIERIKHIFLAKLCAALHLVRVTAPLVVDPATGLNDNLNGVERPVNFDIPYIGTEAEIVHSLAKWKRLALYRYDFNIGKGIAVGRIEHLERASPRTDRIRAAACGTAVDAHDRPDRREGDRMLPVTRIERKHAVGQFRRLVRCAPGLLRLGFLGAGLL